MVGSENAYLSVFPSRRLEKKYGRKATDTRREPTGIAARR